MLALLSLHFPRIEIKQQSLDVGIYMKNKSTMQFGIKQVLLLLLFWAILFAHSTAESKREISQTQRVAPRRNIRSNVIDGIGTDNVFDSEVLTNGFGEKRKSDNSRVSVSTVALFTLAMAAATGLGALPFFFVELDPQWAGICNGMAAGVMLAASFDLIQEGQDPGHGHGHGNWVVMGILTGAIFIWFCKKVMTQNLLSL